MVVVASDPLPVVERILTNPPTPHVMDEGPDGPLGVWSTEDSCYRFLATTVGPGAQTLETGCGVSTAVFVALGAHHRCVTPSPEEADCLQRYIKARDLSRGSVRFDVDSSHRALPRLPAATRFDVVFIDGDHGFPLPVIDWFYGAGRLRRGGILIVDDIEIAAVALLIDVLDDDEGWRVLQRTSKWAAYRRATDQPLVPGPWNRPAFLARHPPSRRQRAVTRLTSRARSVLPARRSTWRT